MDNVYKVVINVNLLYFKMMIDNVLLNAKVNIMWVKNLMLKYVLANVKVHNICMIMITNVIIMFVLKMNTTK